MSAWTDRAKAEARTRWSALTEGLKAARLLHSVFTQGAAWQRQQYQGREAVERVALGLWNGGEDPFAPGATLLKDAHPRDRARVYEEARLALSALEDV